MTALKKTNAMRLLEQAKVPFEFYEYETSDGKIDAKSVAAKIGQAPEQVFKTLVTQSPTHEHFVFVVPSIGELDLKKAAKAAGQKSIEMIAQKQLLPLTGYIHGGCSPLGMKKSFRTTFHEDIMSLETVTLSAGRVGSQIELKPADLLKATKGALADIIVK